jgi:organic hydroperoxide reductase OsmC/OhrA
LGTALDVRGVRSAGNLAADVEGDIEDVAGVMKITKIRVRYRFRIPAGSREKIDRVLHSYAEQCPAYQSVKGCIECTWKADIEEIM